MSSENATPLTNSAPDQQSPGNGSGTQVQEDPARLAAELQDANARVLRAQAELDNYRKRVRREMDDERKYAAAPLLRDLLGVVDNLQRAIDSAEQNSSSAGLLEGVKMVAAQLQAAFERQSCKKIEAVGLPFDPNQHEALAQEPSADHPAGIVTRELQAGYQLHDRILRPAQVFVSSGPPS